MNFRNCLPRTDVIFGEGSLEKAGEETARYGKNVMVVTGQESMKKLGFLERVMESLEEEDLNVFHYEGIEPNPTTEMVDEGAELAMEKDCEVVLAFGGGSVMDVAKGIAVVAGHESRGIWKHVPEHQQGEGLPITEKTLPVLAITSTSGTGSQVTPWAVITNPETKGKPGFGDFPMFPEVSIVDPRIPANMPPDLTAVTGFDVFAHASEVITAESFAGMVEPLAYRAIEYIGEFLPRAYEDGDDTEACEMMALADTYAGISITTGDTHARHGIAHSVSGHYPEIAHGQALATLAIPLMEYNVENGSEETWKNYSKVGVALNALDSVEGSKEAALETLEAVSELIETLDLDKSLSDFGVGEEKISQMAEDSFKYMGETVANNPEEIDVGVAEEILREAY